MAVATWCQRRVIDARFKSHAGEPRENEPLTSLLQFIELDHTISTTQPNFIRRDKNNNGQFAPDKIHLVEHHIALFDVLVAQSSWL